MKQFSKILALVLAITMIVGLGITAFAADDEEPGNGDGGNNDQETVTITITRDNSYVTNPEEGQTPATGNRGYTYYEIFRATYNSHSSSGGGADNDGTPGTITGNPTTGVAYYLKATEDETIISKLGRWVAVVEDDPDTDENEAAPAHWEKAQGNEWFDLTLSADGTQYIVQWDTTKDSDTDTAQAAAQWLFNKGVYVASGSLVGVDTSKDSQGNFTQWQATGLEKGYYLIKGSEGQNLIAATTDIAVNEKNTYPTIDKKEKDEDDNGIYDDYTNSAVPVAIGDEIDYQVIVHIPADANQDITVTDTMTSGLSKKTPFTLTVEVSDAANGTYTNLEATKTVTEGDSTTTVTNYTTDPSATNGWSAVIKPTADTKGKYVKFTFSATVIDRALTDTERNNTVVLNYNNSYSMTDVVKYTTHFTGIKKTAENVYGTPLEGVEFTLKENGAPFYVKLVTKATGEGEDAVTTSYYIPCAHDDEGATTTVVTDANGFIKIRGLDNDKPYTLTETKTLDGYNLLKEDVNLTLIEDKTTTSGEGDEATTTVDFDTNTTWGPVINKSGTELPSTGGIGTTLFYVFGGILVVGAGVVLITKKRMGGEEN